MKKEEKALSSTRIAITFFAFLVFIIGVSLIFKIVLVIKAGQYDDTKRFNIVIANGKNLEVMSLSQSTTSIVIFKLTDNSIKVSEIGRFLGIPIDGAIESNVLDLDQKANSLFFRTVLRYKDLKTNLTIIDLFKILVFTRFVPESSFTIRNIDGNAGGPDLDKTVGRLTADALIEKDKKTIQIINATNVTGLGNRLARLVTNMGGNVIFVTTSDAIKQKSLITYIDKKTYTVERLQGILGYTALKEINNAIADITIIIGEDKANSSSF